MKIPVFSFPWTCYVCKKEMKVTYPTTKDVYETEFKGNLSPVHSHTRKEEVIGNLCPSCKAYQGNFFVMDDGFMGNAYELEKYLVGFFHKKFQCVNCEKEIHQDNKEELFARVQIYEYFLDIEKLSTSEKQEELNQKIKCYYSSVLCKNCLDAERLKKDV